MPRSCARSSTRSPRAVTGPYPPACQLVLYPLLHQRTVDDWLPIADRWQRIDDRSVRIVSSPPFQSTLLFRLLAAGHSDSVFSARRELIASRIATPCAACRHASFCPADTLFQRQLRAARRNPPLRFEQKRRISTVVLLLPTAACLVPVPGRARRSGREPLLGVAAEARYFQRFYHRCLQRLLWARGRDRYVGRATSSGQIDDLRRAYPDAHFIYCCAHRTNRFPRRSR